TTHDIAGTSDPVVYQTWRASTPKLSVIYSIPATSGTHSVTLKFSENNSSYCARGKRVFNVLINGVTVLPGFYYYATAGSCYKALDQTFTATANSSGQIVIEFEPVVRSAAVSGIVVQ